MAESLRFLFSSDLMLGRPLRGLTEWPERQMDLVVEAPFLSATKMFDLAIERSVSFVLLGGNVIDGATAGPRAIRFLFDECARVAKRGIQVIWMEGRHDDFDEWGRCPGVPDNLVRVGCNATEPIVIRDARGCRTAIVPLVDDSSSAPATHSRTDSPHFTIGCITSGKQLESLGDADFDLIAVGGRATYQEGAIDGVSAVCPGTTQARQPGRKHGGLALEVNLNQEQVRWTSHETCAVKFIDETMDYVAAPTIESMRERLGEKMLDVATGLEGAFGIIRWTVNVPAADYAGLEVRQLEDRIQDWLRHEFGTEDSKLWTYRVELRASGPTPDSWMEEDSILGDFLRALRDLEIDEHHDSRLADFLPPESQVLRSHLEQELSDSERDRLLARVREVGFEKLRR